MSIFKKKASSNYLIDVHSHILPGLDDGSRDMNESLAMLKIAYNSGIRDIIATPHFKSGRKNASPDTIKSLSDELEKLSDNEGIPIKIYPGNEIYYFDGIVDAIESHSVMTLNDSNHVLIEFTPMEHYTIIRNGLNEVLSMGYTPILAHIERYESIVANPDYAYELYNMGVEIQVNSSSVEESLGKGVQKFLNELITDEVINYIGTDAHDSVKRMPDMSDCIKKITKKSSVEYCKDITYNNAMSIIG